jgi:signal transduction histidine kinase
MTHIRRERGAFGIDQVAAMPPHDFMPLPDDRVDFGFTQDEIWLRLPVHNATDRPLTRILALNTRFMPKLVAWLVTAERRERLIVDGEDVPFGARPIAYRHLAAPFTLWPGERGVLFIGYYSDGTTALPLSVETETSFLERRAYESTKNAAFYTAAFLIVLYSLIFLPVGQWRVHVSYAVYVSWVILYLAHMDGYTLQYLWPNLPAWNAYASLPLGYGLSALAAIFAMTFLDTRSRQPRVHLLLLGVVAASAAIVLVGPLIDMQSVKQLGFPYTGAATLCFLAASLLALRKGRPGVRFLALGWVVILSAAAFSTFAHWQVGAVAVNASFDVIRLGMLLEALTFALAIADQLRSFRRERNQAMRERMAALEANIALERRNAYVEALADARREQLASASHDLKQPLSSLRLTLQAAIGKADSESARGARHAIDYLDALVRRYLDDDDARVPSARELPAWPRDLGEREAETATDGVVPAGLILDNVGRMFEDEARTMDVDLRVCRSSAAIAADPMPLMRILSNLIANAIRHGEGGKVLFGCRPQDDHVAFVVQDDGTGFASDRLAMLRDACAGGGALADQTWCGIGLPNAIGLARSHGWQIMVDAVPAGGTRFTLSVPRRRPPVRNVSRSLPVAGRAGAGSAPRPTPPPRTSA